LDKNFPRNFLVICIIDITYEVKKCETGKKKLMKLQNVAGKQQQQYCRSSFSTTTKKKFEFFNSDNIFSTATMIFIFIFLQL